MERSEERVLAYQLAAPTAQEELYDVSGGGISIIIPTITLTGNPLSPDLTVDGQ